MKLINKPVLAGQNKLTAELIKSLKKYRRVLWLVPGGSNIPITCAIMDKLNKSSTRHLAIMLTDERYGLVEHPDSNLAQLHLAGFKPKLATVVPVLHDGLDLDQTARRYGEAIEKAVDAADYIIGQFGIGPDGHTAGILPHSPAATKNMIWTVGYKTPDFTRITLTPFAISHVNTAYVFAYGEPKHEALETLKNQMLPITDQPAQIYKHIADSNIYNDQVGRK
jgi:6-phosphogluconolactonase/glucosamine-6-phosphate isomerase/deaminase